MKGELPDTVTAAQLFEGQALPFEGVAEYESLDISNQDGRFRIKTPIGWVYISWTQWIVRHPVGTFHVFSDELFNELYHHDGLPGSSIYFINRDPHETQEPSQRIEPGRVMQGESVVPLKPRLVTRSYMTPERKAYLFMIDKAIEAGWYAYCQAGWIAIYGKTCGFDGKWNIIERSCIRMACGYAQENNVMSDISTAFEVEFRRKLKAVGCVLDERELACEKEDTDAG